MNRAVAMGTSTGWVVVVVVCWVLEQAASSAERIRTVWVV
jgi:hypothetical protein